MLTRDSDVDYAYHIATCSSRFSDLPTALICRFGTKSFAKPETWRTTQMPYVLKNTFLPSYWEGLGGKWLSKIMQVLELRRPLDKKGEKREKIKLCRRRFLNLVCNWLKTIFEFVLNFTNYAIGISYGHLDPI